MSPATATTKPRRARPKRPTKNPTEAPRQRKLGMFGGQAKEAADAAASATNATAASNNGHKRRGRKPASSAVGMKAVLDLPVDFGGVSISDGTARLGITISRENLNIDAADESLCGRRLTGLVKVMPSDADPKQKTIVEDLHFEVRAVFDVKGFRVSPKLINAGLTFSLQDVDLSALCHFSKRSGRLMVTEIGRLDEAEDSGRDEDEGDDDGSGEDASL